MKKLMPAETGKRSYTAPSSRTRTVLFTKQAVCTSTQDWSSTTEQWDEVDLSNL